MHNQNFFFKKLEFWHWNAVCYYFSLGGWLNSIEHSEETKDKSHMAAALTMCIISRQTEMSGLTEPPRWTDRRVNYPAATSSTARAHRNEETCRNDIPIKAPGSGQYEQLNLPNSQTSQRCGTELLVVDGWGVPRKTRADCGFFIPHGRHGFISKSNKCRHGPFSNLLLLLGDVVGRQGRRKVRGSTGTPTMISLFKWSRPNSPEYNPVGAVASAAPEKACDPSLPSVLGSLKG